MAGRPHFIGGPECQPFGGVGEGGERGTSSGAENMVRGQRPPPRPARRHRAWPTRADSRPGIFDSAVPTPVPQDWEGEGWGRWRAS